MKKNMGTLDKTIRILIALVIVALFVTKVVCGTLAIVLLIFAAIFVITSFVSFCPLYTLFGIKTCKK
ncbi:MAG: DUF2892 domain-containing protein [Bacteroidia bacterium]|jgi:hypothetical protein|nr:DUF2892 domain-containing protein [Bacteroidia bacterium]